MDILILIDGDDDDEFLETHSFSFTNHIMWPRKRNGLSSQHGEAKIDTY